LYEAPQIFPDFVVVKVDRDMGELWEELSEGRCRFVMATDKKWGTIETKLPRP
jgi:hypothetical protein